MSDVHEISCALEGWLTIVRQLSNTNEPWRIPRELRAATQRAHPDVTVRPVERLTPRTATLDWYEPGVCHYAEQTWIKGSARRDGQCALTGVKILRGDPVYRPRPTNPAASNAAAMIVAAHILGLPEG